MSCNRIRLVLVWLPLLICLSSCAANSGIFGGNWQLAGLQNQQIRTLAVDPNNLQHIYAGDAQNGVFVSADAGKHWAQQSPGLPLQATIHMLAFDDSGKRLYAATAAGIFVSADAAQHWAAVGATTSGLPADTYTAIAFDLKAPHTIYVGTEQHGAFRSTNDGAAWTNISAGLSLNDTINSLVFDSDAHQLWAATNMGVYRSDNGGAIWQSLNNGLPTTALINAVLPAAPGGGDRGLVFAGTNHGFFRSQDSGAHWSKIENSLGGISVHAILLDIQNPRTVYVATDIGALRSDDSGQTWGGTASGIPKGQSIYALAQGANNYTQLYAASNGIYLYPGNTAGFNVTRIIPLLLILLFFFMLYRLAMRGRNRSREMLKPERIIEKPSSDSPDTLVP